MALIEWGDEYHVGIAVIDAQHQQLVDTVNAFHAQRDHAEQVDIIDFVNALDGYAKAHFATEEAYFVKCSYPDAAAHIEQHQMFVEYLASYRERLDRGDVILPIELTQFMSAWLKEHVKASDQRYGKFFRDTDCS